jgi:hypothetical protein
MAGPNFNDTDKQPLTATTLTDAVVMGKQLPGTYAALAGVVAIGDTLEVALEKIDGNVAATTIVANAALPAADFTSANVTAKVLGAGYAALAGVVTIGDTLEVAVEKLDGNVAAAGGSGTTIKTYTKAMMGGVDADRYASFGMGVYAGKLYIGTYNATVATNSTAAKLMVYDGTTWSIIDKATMGAHNNDNGLLSFCVYNNKLYIGTNNGTAATDATGCKVLCYDGAAWTSFTKATMGGHANDIAIYSMCVYDGKLYIGTYNTTAATDASGAKVISYDGATWTAYTKTTMGGVNADFAMLMPVVYNSKLYFGTENATVATNSTAAKLITYDSSTSTWAIITKATMGGTNGDTSLSSLGIYNSKLYVRSYNAIAATDSTASKFLIYNGATWSTLNKNVMGEVAADRYSPFLVAYGSKFYFQTNNSTNVTDITGSKLVAYDASDGSFTLYPKAMLCGLGPDLAGESGIEFLGKLWFGLYNATASIDITGSRVISFEA